MLADSLLDTLPKKTQNKVLNISPIREQNKFGSFKVVPCFYRDLSVFKT